MTNSSPTVNLKGIPKSTLLIGLLMVLLPLFGGQLSMDTLSLPPDQNWIINLFGATTTPILAQLIPLTAAFATGILLLLRRVISLPKTAIFIPLIVLVGCVFFSITLSDFGSISISAATQWFWYAALFMIVVAGAGRRGVKLALTLLVVALTISAVVGVLEYAGARASDPNYRIFAGYNNPNAAGAAFIFGIPLAVTLLAQSEGLPRLLFGLAAVLQTFALLLTQSKGAILFIGISVVVAIALAWIWKSKSTLLLAGGFVICGALGFGLMFGLSRSNQAVAAGKSPESSQSQSGGALGRFSNLGESATQSAGFRALLWKGTLKIVEERPAGVGIGAYRFWSTRAGLTTQTQLAHNSYLQIAAEASPLATLALIAFTVIAVVSSLKGITRHTEESKILAAGIVGALLAAAGHNLVDSDLYTFALGGIFFALLGLLVAQGADARSPELLLPPIRTGGAVALAMLFAITIFCGSAELIRAEARGLVETGHGTDAKSKIDGLLGIFPNDGVAQSIRTSLAANSSEALDWAKQAAATHPSPKNLRLVGNLELRADNPAAAIAAAKRALEWDPNNLLALQLALNAADKNRQAELAIQYAKRLIGVESTPYYIVRSQPELVPTETFEARIWLAAHVSGLADKIKFLEEAVKGFTKYRDTTVPAVIRFTSGGLPDYGGETLERATKKLTTARTAIQELKGLYRTAVPSWLAEEDALFVAVLAKLAK